MLPRGTSHHVPTGGDSPPPAVAAPPSPNHVEGYKKCGTLLVTQRPLALGDIHLATPKAKGLVYEGRQDEHCHRVVQVPIAVCCNVDLPRMTARYSLINEDQDSGEITSVAAITTHGRTRVEIARSMVGRGRGRNLSQWKVVIRTNHGTVTCLSERFVLKARGTTRNKSINTRRLSIIDMQTVASPTDQADWMLLPDEAAGGIAQEVAGAAEASSSSSSPGPAATGIATGVATAAAAEDSQIRADSTQQYQQQYQQHQQQYQQHQQQHSMSLALTLPQLGDVAAALAMDQMVSALVAQATAASGASMATGEVMPMAMTQDEVVFESPLVNTTAGPWPATPAPATVAQAKKSGPVSRHQSDDTEGTLGHSTNTPGSMFSTDSFDDFETEDNISPTSNAGGAGFAWPHPTLWT